MKRSPGLRPLLFTLGLALALVTAASAAAAPWAPVDAIPAASVITVRAIGDTLLAGTLTRAFVSTDGGTSWLPAARMGGARPVQSLLVRNGVLYAGTNGEGVYTSDDFGQSWHAFNEGLVGGLLDSQLDVSDLVLLGSRLFASTFGAGVYVRDLAGGGAWQPFGEAFEPNQAPNVRAMAGNGSRLLADAGGNGSVFVRDPDDSDWTISWLDNVGLRPGLQAFSTAWTGSGWVVATGVGRGVFASAQGQEPWTFVDLGLGFLNSGTVTAGGGQVYGAFNRNEDVVIERSFDDGRAWEPLDVLPGVFVFALAMHGTDLYAARGDGLWVRAGAAASVPARDPGEGLHFALAGRQPVTGAVHLRFELPAAGSATIELFDVTGRRVDRVVQPALAAGPHEVSFRAGALPPGIYAARLAAGGHQAVLRIVRVE